MALRGNLKDFSLPDVFQLVQLSGKTGVLRIQGPEAEGSIWFRDGDVFFAQSNWRREQLGERLVTAQRITPAALARALELRAAEPEGGRRLGEILVNEGYITQQVLESFVQEQIQDTIFDLMRWDEGEFDFEVLPEVVHEDIGLSVSVENIVMEGSRRLEEWQRIKKKVPSTDMVFKMATAPGEGTFEISLKPVEWALLLLIDGTRSVRELAVETHSTDFEVARVVYGLFSAGLLEVPTDDEIERLRADRARRDDKRAKLDAERAAREAEQGAAALDIEARLAAEAEARRAAQVATGLEVIPAESEERPAEPEVPEAEETPLPPDVVAEAEPERVVEEPEFLAVGAEAPSPDDMAVFEQMMASVLSPQVGGTEPTAAPVAEAGAAPSTPEVSDEEPGLLVVPEPEMPLGFETGAAQTWDFTTESEAPAAEFAPSIEGEVETEPEATHDLTIAELEAALAGEVAPVAEPGVGEIPAIETPAEGDFGFEAIPEPPAVEQAPLPEGFAPSGDFEADLRSLGLGEMPEELLQSAPPTETRPPMSEIEAGAGYESASAEAPLEYVPAPDTDSEAPTGPESISADQDLDSLLASLGSEPAGVISSGTDYGADVASEGVISTDAFLAEFDDVGLSGGLGDELTALTGGTSGRSRPVATVNKLPEEGEVHMLHRDQLVDKGLLEKIIEGIENL